MTPQIPSARGIAILEAVALYRGLTAEQISRLFFPPTETRNKQGEVVLTGRDTEKRKVSRQAYNYIRSLINQGYLFAHPLYRGGPALYALDTKGARLLTEVSDIAEELRRVSRHRHSELAISPTYGLHLLKSNDIRIAIVQSVAHHNYTLTTWYDEKTLRSTHRADTVSFLYNETRLETTLIPDGYFVLETKARPFSHFLEVDLRTETVKTTSTKGKDFARKIAAYIAYFARPARDAASLYEKRYGTPKGRVLTITTGETRLENLKRISEETGARERFWFSTFERIEQADILTAPIWSVATKRERESLIWEEGGV